jgi:hypothetical protein
LARNAFRLPDRIPGACARYLVDAIVAPRPGDDRAAENTALAVLFFDLREFHARFKEPARLRSWLQREAVEWVVKPPVDGDGPLLTTRGFGLLFVRPRLRQPCLVSPADAAGRRGRRASAVRLAAGGR